jgi:glycerate dehydrogenase
MDRIPMTRTKDPGSERVVCIDKERVNQTDARQNDSKYLVRYCIFGVTPLFSHSKRGYRMTSLFCSHAFSRTKHTTRYYCTMTVWNAFCNTTTRARIHTSAGVLRAGLRNRSATPPPPPPPPRRYCCEFSSSSTTSTSSMMKMKRPTALFLNASRLDYDGQLNWSRLEQLCEKLVLHPVDDMTDEQEIVNLVRSVKADIVITKEMTVTAATFQQFQQSPEGQAVAVALLCEAGTGYNNLPVAAARASNVPVCNIPTYSTDAVAHTAITFIMNFSCSMFQQQSMLVQQDRSNFTPGKPFTLPLSELNGATLGLIGGAGRIGTKVAEIAIALGMKVVMSSRAGTLPDDHVLAHHPSVTCTNDVNWVLQQSDYVSLHTPLNDQTRGKFGRAQLEQMKPTAFLVNTSRGGVIHQPELIDCLREKVIAGAGLDVTTPEPPAPDSPLWDLPNLWLTPHTGWRRLETRQRLVDMTADNIEAFCRAQSPDDLINVVN